MTDEPSCEMCPCCCFSCDNYIDSEYPCGDDTEMVICNVLGNTHRRDHCTEHPQAREYLMEPVLKELERLQFETFDYPEIRGFKKAIDLIKNGVEK